MSQFRHNYNARVIGTISLLEEVMKRMKTILACRWSHLGNVSRFSDFEGSKFVVHWIKSLMIIM